MDACDQTGEADFPLHLILFLQAEADRIKWDHIPHAVEANLLSKMAPAKIRQIWIDGLPTNDVEPSIRKITDGCGLASVSIIGVGCAARTAANLSMIAHGSAFKLVLLGVTGSESERSSAIETGTARMDAVETILSRQREVAEAIIRGAQSPRTGGDSQAPVAKENSQTGGWEGARSVPLLILDSATASGLEIGVEIWPLDFGEFLEERYYHFERDTGDIALVEYICRFILAPSATQH